MLDRIGSKLSYGTVAVFLLLMMHPLTPAPRAGQDAATAGTDVIPSKLGALFDYLKLSAYRNFAAKESAPHPSAGPHLSPGLPVRIYVNAVLDASLKAGSDAHPKGSGIVKEMFTEAGELQGWSVSVKTEADSAEGKGWFWVEFTSTTDAKRIAASGQGAPLCVSCHTAGQDFVLSAYPLQ